MNAIYHLPLKRCRGILLASVGLIALYLLLGAPRGFAQTLPGLQAPEKPKSASEMSLQVKAARGEAPLRKLYDHLKVEPSKIRRLPSPTAAEMRSRGSEKILRIGVVRSFGRSLSPFSDGSRYNLIEGDVRVMGVASEGALRTRVHFTEMSLPLGAKVFVYSLENPDEFYGPYEGHGPDASGAFWTPPMAGEGVVIEYFAPIGPSFPADTPFKVSEISHIYKDISRPEAGTCNLDVPAEWANLGKSVGLLDFVTGGSEALCTGTLLNNQANDQTPFLLTANHCFSTQAEAQSLRVYWNYDSGENPPAGTPFTDGANLLVTGTASGSLR